jgi:adenylate cyclase
LTFRTTITLAVMAFITSLALCLIFIQYLAMRAATREAAGAYMDATTASAVNTLRAQLAQIGGLVRVLATSPFLADSDDRSEVDGAVGLFKTALRELPEVDSLYVAYDNGCWLQVRGLATLDQDQRANLSAPATATINVNVIRPTAEGALPMRRVFEDEWGNKLEQLDLWNYGYDARQRSWYRDTHDANRSLVSAPYASFSLGTPMITLSAPLQGRVRGVIAADIKLDSFSKFVNAHRPGDHGRAILFDKFGQLLAHPDFARLIDYAMTHPAHPQLPTVTELRDGIVVPVIRGWDGGAVYEGDFPVRMGTITCSGCGGFRLAMTTRPSFCSSPPARISCKRCAACKRKQSYWPCWPGAASCRSSGYSVAGCRARFGKSRLRLLVCVC